MNPNKPNLEDYYKKALSEKPIVSRDMARSLVESRRKNPAPLSLKTSGRKTMNIIAYSTAALITAGIVAYNAFDYNPGRPDAAEAPAAALISTENGAKARPEAKPDENVTSGKIKITESGAAEENVLPGDGGPASEAAPGEKSAGSNAAPESIINPDVKGISMITLRQSELEKLGLKVNNKEKFVLLDIDKNKAVKLGKGKVEVTSTGGLSDFGDEDIHVVPNEGVTTMISFVPVNIAPENKAPENKVSDTERFIIPRFITDISGAMRFSMLNEESSKYYSVNNPGLDGGLRSEKVDVMEMNLDNEKNSGEAHSKKVTAVIQSSGNNKDNINVSEAAAKTTITLAQGNEGGTGSGTVTTIHVDNNDTSKISLAVQEGTRALGMASIITPQLKEMIINTIIKRVNEKDSTGKMAKLIMQELSGASVNTSNTSFDNLTFEQREFLKSIAMDSVLRSVILKDSVIALMKINEGSTKPVNLNNNLTAMKNKLDEYIRINKFIPVAVSIDGITTDYIVWFDPTPELMEKLPKDVSDRLIPEIETLSKNGNICEYAAVKGDDTMMDIFRACNGAIENLAVSPNPTSGNIKLNYKLSEARNITVAVHDMYGRRKMNLAENLHMQAGPCENSYTVTGVEPGMYLIVVRSEVGEKAVQRIIIK